MEQTKLISIRVSVKVLDEIQKIGSDIELGRSIRIKKILEYGVKKMKEENLTFKSQESIIIGQNVGFIGFDERNFGF